MSMPGTGSAIGGKASALAELVRAGQRVPKFGVVTAGAERLDELIQEIGFPLAVRSSATVEDGEQGTFAGQFQSFLNLRSTSEVQAAVQKCFDSARAANVVAYGRLQGRNTGTPQMAVIVQRMVEPQLAGVAFTVCPSTGAEQVVIEACEGLGDRLLAGRASPLASDHPLLLQHRPQIEAACRRIQRHFGRPQDIEFAIVDEVLYILQSRPITQIEFAASTDEWTSANFREGGVSSGVCSPLMWSLYEYIWDRALKQSLREIRLFRGDFLAGRMFFGRPYWNLGAVKDAVATIPGFVEREFDEDLCVECAYDGEGRRTPVSLLSVLSALPTLLSLPGFIRRQEQSARRLLAEFDSLSRRWEQPHSSSGVDLRRLIERDYWRVESTYFRTIFAVSLAKLEFKKLFPGCDYAVLMAGLPPLRHLTPVRQMRTMAERDEHAVAKLATAFRHHCRWGVDVRHPRWDEDLEFVAELLQSCQATGERDTQPSDQRARAEALARLPWWKRLLFGRKVDRLRQLVWLREELRDLSGQMYYRIRREVLAIADIRGMGGEIFFQTFQEIETDDRSQIEARREVFDSYRNFQPPSVIGRRVRYQRDRAATGLSGIGASGGIAEGTAHIAHNPADALWAEQGAILICPFVEPGWTPVLCRVAGLVAEIGGRLSHSAVICREMGIPAVLGVPEATRKVRAGQRVTIDGYLGQVRVHDAASAATSPA